MAELKPDFEQARRFLQVLDPAADYRGLLDGYPDGFTFQTFDDKKERKDRTLATVLHGTLQYLQAQLTRYNNAGAGVFVTINETDGVGRKLSNIINQRAVWIEDDEGLNVELTIEPHLISETSTGKYHKIFLVEGLTKEQHQILQDRLSKYYGSDRNAKDLTRVLRVPGFYHCKSTPRMVKLIQALDTKPYSVEEIFEAFPEKDVELSPKSVSVTSKKVSKTNDDYVPLSDSEPLPDINENNAAEYLPPAETITDRHEWLRVGLALHHQFYGSDVGLALFDAWSQEVYGYQGFDDVAATWSGLGNNSEGVITFKTLVQAKKNRELDEKKDAYNTVIQKGLKLLAQCDDPLILLDEVAPKLAYLVEGNIGFEKELMEALQQRYAELKPGGKLLRGEAQKAMRKKAKAERTFHDDIGLDNPDTPEWAKGWIYVGEEDRFFNHVTRASLTQNAFRNQFTSKLRKIGVDDTDAAKYVLDNGLVPKVIRSMYMPSCGILFVHDGVSCVNSCSKEFMAPIPTEVQDWEAVNIFKTHIENICGGWNREAHIFCNWLATALGPNYRKIRWAIMLIGKFGDGKSMFSEFASTALGVTNCKPISSSLLMSSSQSGQSGWAEGAMFGFVEEVKWHGHNRYDAANSVKAYITNDVVPCKKMYKESIAIPNTMNYFFTSNYMDGLPVEKGDRRFYMLLSKLEEAVNLEGLEGAEYFNRLFKVIKDPKCVGSVLRWLADLPAHPEFNADGRAPMTVTKAEITRLVSDDTPDRIMEIIEDDENPLYQKDIVLFDALFQRLSMMPMGVMVESPRKLTTLLSAMGFASLTRLRIQGERHSIWVRRDLAGEITAEQAKAAVEKRIQEKDNNGLLLDQKSSVLIEDFGGISI